MKKFNILSLFSLIVIVSVAQVNVPRTLTTQEELLMQHSVVVEHTTTLSAEHVSTSFSDLQSAVKAQQMVPTSGLDVFYFRPVGTFFQGFTRDYRSTPAFILHGPAGVPLTFSPRASDASAVFSWTLNDTENTPLNNSMEEIDIETNGNLNFEYSITPPGSVSFLPRVTATTASASASYVIGDNVTAAQFFRASFAERIETNDGTVFDGRQELPSLTLANLWANQPAGGNLFIGFTDSVGFTPRYSNEDGPVRGVMQIIPQLSAPLHVESITILAIALGGVTEVVPTDGEMRLQIFYLNSDGSFGERIAESTTNEFVATRPDNRGAFVFRFRTTVGGFGIDTPFTIAAGRTAVVIVTGFDETWDFNIFMGGAGGFAGSSYTLHGDSLKIHTFGYSNRPDLPMTDMFIQFNGSFADISTNVDNPIVVPLSNVDVFVSNDAFELNYTSDFNSVTIFNISGQAVARYDLPAVGNFIIPTGNLPRGAYILRLAGQQVETVKVIK